MSSSDQHDRLQADFDAYKRRSEDRIAAARVKGREEAVDALLDVIDDCDRALSQIQRTAVGQDATYSGVEQLRSRVLRHFARLGFTVFAVKGDMFDPQRHEAIAVEAGVGQDGSILTVHRRGWEHSDGRIVRPAMVTVLKGATQRGAPTATASSASMADRLDHTPARPRRRRKPTMPGKHEGSYVCPFGIPGCNADCPGCAPIEDSFIVDFDEESVL